MKKLKEWSYVSKAMKILGWHLIADEKDKKIFAFKNQRIILLKFPKNRWKLMIYEGKRLIDSNIDDEEWVKVYLTEIGLQRGFSRVLFGLD